MILPFTLRLVVFSILALQAWGQNSNQTFGWKFREDFLSTNLQACFELRLVVFPNLKNETAGSFSGVPPYYMMAFPEGGQPITTLVGENNDTLAWTPTHPVGTKLILQLVDATGNTGGTSGSVFEIVDNPNSSNCNVPPPPKDFTITSNITQDGRATLETCQPWRLNINGGTPPYKVVLDARNSPVITNITIPGTDNAVVFINRADPGTVLFASVHDVSGRWATGTQFVSTTGSTNITCIGHGTITTTQEKLDQEDAGRKNAKQRTSIIIGVVVAVIGLLLIGGGVWLCLRRRRKAQESEESGQDTLPRQFIETGSSGQILSINNFLPSGASTSSPNKTSFSPGAQSLSYTSDPYNPYHESSITDSNRVSSVSGQGANLYNRPSFANFPQTSVRRSKAAEATQEAMSEINNADLTQSSSTMAAAAAGRHVWPARLGSLGGDGDIRSPTDNEFIYQHLDAGQVVRELPPPYIPPRDVTTPDNSDGRS